MISDLTQSILFCCLSCSEITVKKITAFDFPNNKSVELECINEKCELPIIDIKNTKDKYKIIVTCPVCSENHTFYISVKTFWNKDFFILKCPVSGVGIIFVGKDSERLMDEYNAQNEILAGMMVEEDFDESEIDLLMDIFERINTLAKRNAIMCSCGEENISIELNVNGISLLCDSCNKKVEFDISEESLHKLMNFEYLKI